MNKLLFILYLVVFLCFTSCNTHNENEKKDILKQLTLLKEIKIPYESSIGFSKTHSDSLAANNLKFVTIQDSILIKERAYMYGYTKLGNSYYALFSLIQKRFDRPRIYVFDSIGTFVSSYTFPSEMRRSYCDGHAGDTNTYISYNIRKNYQIYACSEKLECSVDAEGNEIFTKIFVCDSSLFLTKFIK